MKLNRQKILKDLKTPASPLQTILLVTLAALVYLIRAHSYFFKPQLFAEDGVLWLADGYNKTPTAILEPVNGFLHVAERLFGLITAHLPLHLAPFLFVTSAWALFIIMTYYLLSHRTKILSTNFERLFVVLALCLIANVEVFFFGFSNSIFLMGVIGALIMIAEKPRNKVVEIAEKVFFVISGLTLPFAWFYLPIALVERFKYKRRDTFFLYASIVTSIVQFIYFLTSHADRGPVTLFSLISKYTLLEIYNQMIIPAIRFARVDIPVLDFGAHQYSAYFVYMIVATLAVATYVVLKRSNKQVWYLLIFLAGMTFASLKSPTVHVPTALDAIKHMSIVTGGGRYFIYGIIAINLIFVKAAYVALAPRARYALMSLIIAFGLLSSLHYGSFFVNKDFNDYAGAYSKAIDRFESGHAKTVIIPVNPTPWVMLLSNN